MNSHTRIDPDKFDTDFGSTRKKGISLELAMSPYDVPTDISGGYCGDRKKFVIKFSYPGGAEKTLEKPVSTHVLAQQGVSSGRIYRLEVDVDGLGVHEIRLTLKPILQERLTEAINALNAAPRNVLQSDVDRSQVNARVLREVRDHYLESVAG